ncbi:spinster family MFS transporter [Pseudonocardia sp. DLS-67]
MHDFVGNTSREVPGRRRQIYIVALFTVLYMMMYLDRNIVSLLLESIKMDLDLSDTTLALIAGFGFSFFHTVLGFPMARWADRSDRRRVLTIAAALWGGMTVLCGMAHNAIHLALARIGVGIGEATSPVLHSVVADSTTKNSRAGAMSVLLLGGPLAALLCYPVVGWIDSDFGWRTAFYSAGIAGLLIGLVLFLTFRDTARMPGKRVQGAADEHRASPDDVAPPLRETLAFMLRQRTFVLTAAGYVVSQFGIQGFTVWAPTYLRRIHDLTGGQVGASFGISTGVLGIAGSLVGAVVLTWSNRHGDRWKLLWPAIATFLASPLILAATLLQSVVLTLVVMGGVAFMVAFKFGPVVAVNQSVVRPRMRALASSVQGLTASLLAIGLGPLYVGALSDTYAESLGADSLRYALMSCALFTVVGSALLAYGSRWITADIATAERATPAVSERPA